MLTQTVLTHRRCNQACTHCVARRATDDPSFVSSAAVRSRIDEAARGGAREIVLSGGEPTMRRDLVELVALVRERGLRSVLETNATGIDDDLAMRLRDAGMGTVRVNLARVDEHLDAITRDPGGRDATLGGLRALLRADVDVEIAITIVRASIDGAAAVPAFVRALSREATTPSGSRISVLVQYAIEAPEGAHDAVVDHQLAGETIVAIVDACEATELPVRLAPDAALAPCMLPRDARGTRSGRGLAISSTRGHGTREGHRRIDACTRCDVHDRCPGVSERYVARFGVPTVEPIRGERAKRRLTLAAAVPEQIEAELVQPSRANGASGEAIRDAVIRVVFHCNQACRFCFVSTHLPEAGFDRVQRAIREAAARGERIVLSGGEPTLSPDLVEHVKLARSLSREHITLQTNAIRCADRALAQALRDAGLDEATVSLHGATAATSDAITEAPGTFEKTLRGIDALNDVGVTVTLNFVICGRNLHELTDYVELVAARWPSLPVNVSFVAASTDVVPRDLDTIPRYSDVRAPLGRAVERARELSLKLHGFEAMCGMPLCVGPLDPRSYLRMPTIPAGFDRGEFLHVEACDGCLVRGVCWGVRKGYAALHGTSELRRVTE